ncbi:uncharacterized protein NPIL_35121, partial [Nephila pilipes]
PFRFGNKDFRIIVDCTEFPIQKPSSPMEQQLTFSRYKNTNTLKGMIKYDKCKDSCLPPISKFYNELNEEAISVDDYNHEKKYAYKLDPCWYFTTPALSWDAMLLHSKVTKKLFTDYNMLLFIENGIRGNISQCSNRYAIEEKNEYSTHLYAIQEEVRGKFNLFKSEEIRQETEKYKNLINFWGLPDAVRPQAFQHQSRRKNSTPIKTPIAKKQRTTPDETECQNRFQTLAIEEPVEEIEVDEASDEDGLRKGNRHPPPTCAHCQGEHTANHLQCPMNPLNRPKKEDKKKKATEERQKLRAALKEKSDIRTGANTARPNNHTAPTTYAEAAKSSPAQAPQTQAPGSIGDTFNQLKDPECINMFQIIKKYLAIAKSNKSTADKFTEIMTLLEIDNIINVQ